MPMEIIFIINKNFTNKKPTLFFQRPNRRADTFGSENLRDDLMEKNIEEKLLSLDTNKACGVDEVSTFVLKKCARGFARPLSLIFRKSIAESCVPTQWKEANISPIFKKGSRLVAANYRPVSLTSVVCKILEGIIRDRLLWYVINEGLLANEQHGFVPGKGCVSNLLETLDFVTKALSDGHPIDIIYLDFLKAFDMVPHRRQIHKLKGLGIKVI